jgi:hypothetical protein
MEASTYWKKNLRRPDQKLADFAQEIKALTEKDKEDLDRWAQEEMDHNAPSA